MTENRDPIFLLWFHYYDIRTMHICRTMSTFHVFKWKATYVWAHMSNISWCHSDTWRRFQTACNSENVFVFICQLTYVMVYTHQKKRVGTFTHNHAGWLKINFRSDRNWTSGPESMGTFETFIGPQSHLPEHLPEKQKWKGWNIMIKICSRRAALDIKWFWRSWTQTVFYLLTRRPAY